MTLKMTAGGNIPFTTPTPLPHKMVKAAGSWGGQQIKFHIKMPTPCKYMHYNLQGLVWAQPKWGLWYKVIYHTGGSSYHNSPCFQESGITVSFSLSSEWRSDIPKNHMLHNFCCNTLLLLGCEEYWAVQLFSPTQGCGEALNTPASAVCGVAVRLHQYCFYGIEWSQRLEQSGSWVVTLNFPVSRLHSDWLESHQHRANHKAGRRTIAHCLASWLPTEWKACFQAYHNGTHKTA